jgi:hypothetical protein
VQAAPNYVLQRTPGTFYVSTHHRGPAPLNTALGAMTLVRVASPESESHIALIAARLEAAGIPYFVHNAGIGGLLPGLQVANYNTRSVMVPASAAAEAARLIGELELEVVSPATSLTAWDKLRVVAELFLLGWFVPGPRKKPASTEGRT